MVERAPSSKTEAKTRQDRRTGFIIAAVVIVIIMAIIGISYYPTYVAPFRRAVITVDNTTIRMDYFLKRTRLSGADPIAMLRNLTNEQLIKVGATQYVAEVTPEDVKQELRKMAQGTSESISENEFKEWYRQQLNENGFKDSEFKEMVRTGILAARLQSYLEQRMSKVAEQVHLYYILVETSKEAAKVKERLKSGEKFADLAREVSLDEQTKDKGGDLGWVPRGVGAMEPQLEFEAFDLKVGDVSEAIPFVQEVSTGNETTPTVVGYRLLMVAEKADTREVDEKYLPALKSKLLDNWVAQEMKNHQVEYRGLRGSFDSETYAWITWQLSKK
ncbi:MAG: peptidylprolyl isomerase [Chloroflexi bacterium]|nr:peptidylprolyl isomerase [Chloroflexota bacterium]